VNKKALASLVLLIVVIWALPVFADGTTKCPAYIFRGNLHAPFILTGEWANEDSEICAALDHRDQPIEIPLEEALRLEPYANTHILGRGAPMVHISLSCQNMPNEELLYCQLAGWKLIAEHTRMPYRLPWDHPNDPPGVRPPDLWIKLPWPNAQIRPVPVWQDGDRYLILYGDLLVSEVTFEPRG